MLSSIKFRDRIGAVIALATFLALLAGCGGSSSGTNSADKTAKPGGTLTIGLSADPETLTPAESLTGQSMDVINQINETLFATNEAGRLKPLLAKKMVTSPDGLTSTITLRSDVDFSDGFAPHRPDGRGAEGRTAGKPLLQRQL